MNYLSTQKSLELFGSSTLTYSSRSIKIYTLNNNQKIALKQSKLYDDGVSYWFGIVPNTLVAAKENKLDYFCFVLGYEGVIKLPIKVLFDYIKDTDKSINKDTNKIKHYHIRFKFNEKVILYNSKNELNVIDYLSYNKDLVISDLNSKDNSQILKEANRFNDYDQQYTLSEKINKYRKESRAQKERIAILENHQCQVCNYKYEFTNNKGIKKYIIEVDHIIDKANGGGETIDNLWVLCPNCHRKKTYGIIVLDKIAKIVYENGSEIKISDNHLGWNKI